jgi:hypothetical protein
MVTQLSRNLRIQSFYTFLYPGFTYLMLDVRFGFAYPESGNKGAVMAKDDDPKNNEDKKDKDRNNEREDRPPQPDRRHG